MTEEEEKEKLRLIDIAIKNFPKVLERQRKAAEHNMEIKRRFAPFSKALLEFIQKQKKEQEEKEN